MTLTFPIISRPRSKNIITPIVIMPMPKNIRPIPISIY